MVKLTEIGPSGPLPGADETDRTDTTRRGGPTRSGSAPSDRLGGRPPQATGGTPGQRPRLSVELQQPPIRSEIRHASDSDDEHSSSWETIPLRGSDAGAATLGSDQGTLDSGIGRSGRTRASSELGRSDRTVTPEMLAAREDAEVRPPPGCSWRDTLTSAFGALANGASAAAGYAGDALGTAYNRAAGAMNGAATRAGYVAVSAGDEIKKQGEALSLMLPYKRVLGAVGGHLVHQSAAVGLPTFLREMMVESMVLSMRHMPPHQALALQVLVGMANVGLQVLRRHQEARNPDEAARGFHAMTREQWDALPEREKDKLRTEQDKHSRMVFNIQVAASLTHIGIGTYAVVSKDKDLAEMPVKLFANDFKAMVYAGMRDSIQASFSMVNTPESTHGLIGTHLTASAAAYSMTTAVGNYAFTFLPPLVPKGALATSVLQGDSHEMSRSEAWLTRAAVNTIKAAINTLVHTSDWSFMTQQEANQWGTTQHWEPKAKFLDREKHDYSRLLDNTPTRITLIAGSNAMSNLASLLMKDLSPEASTAVLNLMSGAYEGLIYKTIGNTWQAQAAVRAAASAAPARPATPPRLAIEGADPERGPQVERTDSNVSAARRGQG